MKLVYGCLVLLMITGCATSALKQKSSQLSTGDSKEKVKALFGEPGDRQFKADNESWQYCETGHLTDVDSYLLVWLFEGKVTGVNTYTRKSPPFQSCSDGYRTVNWSDAPTHTIEVRSR